MEEVRNDIIKEYKNYCSDLKLKISNYSKTKFLNDYILHYRVFYGVHFTEDEIQGIKIILKEVKE